MPDPTYEQWRAQRVAASVAPLTADPSDPDNYHERPLSETVRMMEKLWILQPPASIQAAADRLLAALELARFDQQSDDGTWEKPYEWRLVAEVSRYLNEIAAGAV